MLEPLSGWQPPSSVELLHRPPLRRSFQAAETSRRTGRKVARSPVSSARPSPRHRRRAGRHRRAKRATSGWSRPPAHSRQDRRAGGDASGPNRRQSLLAETKADGHRLALRALAGIHRPERHQDRCRRQGQRRIVQRRAGRPPPEFPQDHFGLIAPRREFIDLYGGRRRQPASLDNADTLQPFEPQRQDIGANAE